MSPEQFTTAAIDYLQRTGATPHAVDNQAPATGAPETLRRLLRVGGVGHFDKQALARPGEAFRLISEDVLIGLYNYKIAVAVEITADLGVRSIAIGTWFPAEGARPKISEGTLKASLGILEAALSSLYPFVDLNPKPSPPLSWTHGGLVLGIPSAKPPESLDGSLPVDRLLRAMGGTDPWSVLVLAQPLPETITQGLRLQILNEIRAVTGAAAGMGQRPASQHYVELLGVSLKSLTEGQGGGVWRTGVYLLGNETSYYRLASVWRGIFSGATSTPEPVRVFDDPGVCELARAWALPDPPKALRTDEQPPGHFCHPFPHQTLLTSQQLAAYVHLPRLETQGFAVTLVPDFDVVPAPVKEGERLVLGKVIERNLPGMDEVALRRDQLTTHAFVTGVTGAGKTTSVFGLLMQMDEAQVPFLVIEPAKAEYRALLNHPRIGPRLQVFTPGNETVAPLRLNPFEFPKGVSVGVHIDLLRSVFHASFGMWTPLPQVLEVCVHEIYRDRGWDVITNCNHRLTVTDDDRSPAFPVLADLLTKVNEVAGRLGYEERITADIRAALRTRLASLCSGGKGRMLNVQRSVPLTKLLEYPTVLELEGLGDDDDKAFVMGLLLVQLAEQRRTEGPSTALQHLLVVEEAHRLLANPGAKREESQADPRAKAVETFTHLLAEVRAYGQGIMIVDQIPSKLAPDVIKNTGLKIAHRIVSGDDRAVLGAAMGMTERQQRALAILKPGFAAVAMEGEDAPLLVRVNRVEISSAKGVLDDQRIKAHMTNTASNVNDGQGCHVRCGEETSQCEAARSAIEDQRVQRTFARLVLSILFDRHALARRWPELLAAVEPARPPRVPRQAYLRAIAAHAACWLSERRGAQMGWLYSDTSIYADALRQLMIAHGNGIDTSAAWGAFATAAQKLELGPGPFPACKRIWNKDDPPCRCWFPVADLIGTGIFDTPWREAAEADIGGEGRKRSWEVAIEAAYHIIEFPFPDDDLPPDVSWAIATRNRRVAFCVAQQLLARDPTTHPRTQLEAMDMIMRNPEQSR